MVYCDEENYANSNGEPGPACQAKNYVARFVLVFVSELREEGDLTTGRGY